MKICIAGGNGFIGTNLIHFLTNAGHETTVISHRQLFSNEVTESIRNSEVVINLMGESIAGRWTSAKKKRILESRILSTQALIQVIKNYGTRVKIIIGVSAVGLYDSIHAHTEKSMHYSDGFIKEVVINWEAAYLNAGLCNVRLCILRLGVVLGSNGGMYLKLRKMMPAFAGIVIKGQHNFPFVHINDLVRCFEFIIYNDSMEGIVNVTSPHFIAIDSFYKLWASVRKVFLRIYLFNWIIRLAMSEAAVLLLEGQSVIPEKLSNAGFVFNYENPESALLQLGDINKIC